MADYGNPEPVPPATQLAVLPFIAAVDGFLRKGGDVPELRITIHRSMSLEGKGYLQQVCGYMTADQLQSRGVGRVFPANFGIIGAAYNERLIWRTRRYPDVQAFLADLVHDQREVGDKKKPEDVGQAYLAVPFVGGDKQVVLILYAECNELNFFADDDRIRHLVAMCNGFCRLFNWLQEDPFPNLRNFPLQMGFPVTGDYQVFRSVQEPIRFIDPPKFDNVSSFNYEAAAA